MPRSSTLSSRIRKLWPSRTQQQVPEDLDSFARYPIDRKYIPSERASLRRFLREGNFRSSASISSHHPSFSSTSNAVEGVPCRQPHSVDVESSGANPTPRPPIPLGPAVFQSPTYRGYQYYCPQPGTHTSKERQDRYEEAENERCRYRDAPATVSHTRHLPRSDSVVLRAVHTAHFEVYGGPHAVLETGTPIMCFGDMAGEWVTTGNMKRHKNHTDWEWVNHNAQYYTVVRLANQYAPPPPTVAERMERVAGKVRKFAQRTLRID
ncbi:hypothetical protein DFH06DRAFT_1130915 [Mycena polygramma]|nr:hypothetical protein DFH06DRAFT_1130915 [Mycena polygramma]